VSVCTSAARVCRVQLKGANAVRSFFLFTLGASLSAALVLAIPAGPAAAGAEATPGRAAVTVEKVEYRGWKNNLKISNGEAELIVTLDVGPRVISYKLAGGTNVFKNWDATMGTSGEPNWISRGGHRLWAGPEDITRTYAPDNGPVASKELGPGQVRLTQPPDVPYGVQKEMDVALEPAGSKVTVTHRITNVGDKPTSLAIWCLTVMAPGGIEVIALPPKHPHPGDVKNARSPADFAADQNYTVWPFTDFSDPRWHLGAKFITLTQDSRKGATKIGLMHHAGGVGYLNDGTLFVKRFTVKRGALYPDRGVNYETFTNEEMLEMESLGPLTRLAPGKAVEHVEKWELFGGLGQVTTEDEIARVVAPKLK
jgi:hypothetical protein